MSFSEKPDDEFSEQEPENDQKNNEITNIEENQRDSLNNDNNNNKKGIKKIVHCNIINFYFIQ